MDDETRRKVLEQARRCLNNLIGGTAEGLLAMLLLRHKVSNPSFKFNTG